MPNTVVFLLIREQLFKQHLIVRMASKVLLAEHIITREVLFCIRSPISAVVQDVKRIQDMQIPDITHAWAPDCHLTCILFRVEEKIWELVTCKGIAAIEEVLHRMLHVGHVLRLHRRSLRRPHHLRMTQVLLTQSLHITV